MRAGNASPPRFALFSDYEVVLLALTAATFLVLGRELSVRLWRSAAVPLSTPEQIVSAASIGFALWLGSLWALALAGWLTAPAIAIRNIVFAVAAAALWLQRWRDGSRQTDLPLATRPPLALFAFVPLLLWCAFILWRGSIVPPLSHDVLAYHLPKAAFYTRAAAYDPLPALPSRARNIPVNYEMLLADVLLIEGDDELTEWLSLLHYLFFVAAGVAVAHRWWGGAPMTDATIALLCAATPVALLHSGAHKNDLMTAAFMTAAMVWLGRFVSAGELRALTLAAATLMMAAGTKPQAAVLALAAIPFALWKLSTRPAFGVRLARVAAISALCIILLGGAFWPLDRRAAAPAASPGKASGAPVSFGDWQNLWQVPYVLVAAPFSRDSMALSVPWADTPWFWRRYEMYFSELGLPFSICALLLPVGVWATRRQGAQPRTERIVVSAVALATFVAMLPVVFRPLGFYAISAPRYVLFIVPLVFAWTIAPLLQRRPAVRALALTLATVVFALYAVRAATNDLFVPLKYVAWALGNPDARVIPFDPNRAASIVDRIAAPGAVVAIEAADGTWIYPTFGAFLTRHVELIPSGTVPPRLSDAEWLAIDRKFAAVWKHRDFENLSQTGRFIARGAAPLFSDPLFAAVDGDRRWERIYVDAPTGQAVFRRRLPDETHR